MPHLYCHSASCSHALGGSSRAFFKRRPWTWSAIAPSELATASATAGLLCSTSVQARHVRLCHTSSPSGSSSDGPPVCQLSAAGHVESILLRKEHRATAPAGTEIRARNPWLPNLIQLQVATTCTAGSHADLIFISLVWRKPAIYLSSERFQFPTLLLIRSLRGGARTGDFVVPTIRITSILTGVCAAVSAVRRAESLVPEHSGGFFPDARGLHIL